MQDVLDTTQHTVCEIAPDVPPFENCPDYDFSSVVLAVPIITAAAMTYGLSGLLAKASGDVITQTSTHSEGHASESTQEGGYNVGFDLTPK